jgi:two-component system sensor histidine kinase/response regulator
MGGDLTVNSMPGTGSTFAFTIPVQRADAANLSTSSLPRHILSLAPNQPSYRILVVEDNDMNRQLLVQLLQSVGFEVQAAANGQDAIALWQTWQPQLIWMDMRMPMMDGYEATRRIRAQESLLMGHSSFAESQEQLTNDQEPITTAQPQLTKIIALTASAFEENRAQVLHIGCNDFVRKPFQETELLEKMIDYLGVQYLYAEVDEAVSVAPSISDSFDAIAALQAISDSWLNQLYQATLQLDAQQLATLIAQITPNQPLLAALLTEKLDSFDFELILKLVQAAMP